MTRKILALAFAFTCGAAVGHVAFPAAVAQERKVVTITHFYKGADNQTHAEEKDLEFAGKILKLLPVTGAELHRAAGGSVADWHPAPARQYVITLSGKGEIEVAGGKRVPVWPGHIELLEDVSGKGHVTRVTSTEDRVTLWLPLADQTGR
jgi:hypothetical protein